MESGDHTLYWCSLRGPTWVIVSQPHNNNNNNMSFLFITREYIDVPNNSLRIAYFESNRLFILLLQAEKEIRHFTQKLHVQIENKPRSPRSETII
jgi:hypothetical protein